MEGNGIKKASVMGILWKAIFGILIAFMIAIPRIQDGDFILSNFGIFYTMDASFISYLIQTVLFGVFIAIVYGLFISLKMDNGPILNFIKFTTLSIFEGILLAQAVLVISYWAAYFAEIAGASVTAAEINQVFVIAIFCTMIAVLIGLALMPILARSEGAVKIGSQVVKIFVGILAAFAIIYIVSYLMMLFGSLFNDTGFFYQMFVGSAELIYGTGPIAWIIAFIGVFTAEVLFIFSLIVIKESVLGHEKHLEWFGAGIMVNGVLKVFVQIFQLLIKFKAMD